jgi:hypothetical protein
MTGAGAGHERTGAGAGAGAGHEMTGAGAGHEKTGAGAGHATGAGAGAGHAIGAGAGQHIGCGQQSSSSSSASALVLNPASEMTSGASASKMEYLILSFIVFLHRSDDPTVFRVVMETDSYCGGYGRERLLWLVVRCSASGVRSFRAFQRQNIVIPPLCGRITRHNLFITADYFFFAA